MNVEEMKPGAVRVFKKGKGNSVVLAVGVWAKRRGKQLHIDITGDKKFHTTVTSDEKSDRYHRTLFRNLRRVLISNNCWHLGEEDVETEKRRNNNAQLAHYLLSTVKCALTAPLSFAGTIATLAANYFKS